MDEMRATRFIIMLMVLTAVALAVAANVTPFAEFSAYRLPNGPETAVLFDASASTDEDGQIVAYQWVFGDGTTGSGVENEHTFPRVDSYDVTLLASDDGGSWHLITQSVDVSTLPTEESVSGSTESTLLAASAPAIAANVPVGNRVGQRAPGFTLPDLEGDLTVLSDFLGQVVVLEFWLSTCPGCLASVPHLEALRLAYEEQGLVVLLISLDDSARATQRFMTENGHDDFVVVHETRPKTSGTRAAYDVSGTPKAFLIDRTGVIRHAGSPSEITDELVNRWL
ncbi:MAG: redoxin domain-containing protein [Candidatus Bipolaricaulia bacterium]